MSSGTPNDPDAGRRIINSAEGRFMERNRRLGLSPRQQALNRLWAWYRCASYDARRLDWNGQERLDPIAHEAVATAGFLPPGFYDAGQTMPLKFRRPAAPYPLDKVIVDRFTGLLFSERRHPKIRVDGDPTSEDYVTALSEAARVWPAMIQARTYGGAVGTVAVGFQFADGQPVVEVHDPRWLIPTFGDRSSLKLRRVEKRLIYPIEVQDDRGVWIEVPHWYRRVVDEQTDVLWEPVPVEEGDEPDWDGLPKREVAHGFGFCPVIWVQNLPVQDDLDGDPDCHGTFDAMEAIDALISQANRGVVMNCDPTLVVKSDQPLAEIRKGSDNAIKLLAGGDAKYMEITGGGPKSALELAEQLRKYVLEACQCVLEHPDVANRTAKEVERAYSSMLSKADVLREQYGEKCVKPLIRMMIAAVRLLGQPKIGSDGATVVQTVKLPPRVDRSSGTAQIVPRKFDEKLDEAQIDLDWPGYFEPSLVDAQAAVQAAAQAKLAALIDDEHAAQFVAEFFGVEDVPGMLARAKAQQQEEQARMEAQAMQQMAVGRDPGVGGGPPSDGGGQ